MRSLANNLLDFPKEYEELPYVWRAAWNILNGKGLANVEVKNPALTNLFRVNNHEPRITLKTAKQHEGRWGGTIIVYLVIQLPAVGTNISTRILPAHPPSYIDIDASHLFIAGQPLKKFLDQHVDQVIREHEIGIVTKLGWKLRSDTSKNMALNFTEAFATIVSMLVNATIKILSQQRNQPVLTIKSLSENISTDIVEKGLLCPTVYDDRVELDFYELIGDGKYSYLKRVDVNDPEQAGRTIGLLATMCSDAIVFGIKAKTKKTERRSIANAPIEFTESVAGSPRL